MKRSGKITDLFQLRTNKLPKTTDTDNIGNIESVENENVVSTSINFDSQDIGAYINLREKNIILNDLKREQLLTSPWVPPSGYVFPIDNTNKRNLRFQMSWINRFSWLVYSEIEKGALCKFCVLFSNSDTGKGSHEKTKSFVTQPFKKWKNAIEKFNDHENCQYHKLSKERAEYFLSVNYRKQKSVIEVLNSEQARQASENRKKLYSIVETIILCGRLEMSLRGMF
ncbi:unnamed protein product [Macrosiphum euphorbiae]|uniref:TTF-type domain-containing protein n=1 Tax=Macrosiphum euphorbiae TaxID=13131 RepID=A0AAV0VQW8_9HEMI|nr:unnamed protein product [Macrosiphum euphorbiae]